VISKIPVIVDLNRDRGQQRDVVRMHWDICRKYQLLVHMRMDHMHNDIHNGREVFENRTDPRIERTYWSDVKEVMRLIETDWEWWMVDHIIEKLNEPIIQILNTMFGRTNIISLINHRFIIVNSHSSFIIHHSSFIIHHSSFINYQLSIVNQSFTFQFHQTFILTWRGNLYWSSSLPSSWDLTFQRLTSFLDIESQRQNTKIRKSIEIQIYKGKCKIPHGPAQQSITHQRKSSVKPIN
jgi:hypothetical protein